MSKSSDTNTFRIEINRAGTRIGHIWMVKESGQTLTIGAAINNVTINGTEYKKAAIQLDSSDGNIYIAGNHVLFNGSQKW